MRKKEKIVAAILVTAVFLELVKYGVAVKIMGIAVIGYWGYEWWKRR
nr:hypothetical protein [uncultured Schaedlerella sp.]